MLDNLVDIIFPRRCAVCDDVLGPGSKGICASCRPRLSYVSEPRCMRCGKEIENSDEEYCGDCTKTKRSFEGGFPLFNYIPPLSDAITRLKYHGRQEYAGIYGREIAKAYGAHFKMLGVECLVPVPLHKDRLKKRGYNQAALIAKGISAETGIPVNERLLVRDKKTAPQKELSDVDREKNLAMAFSVGKTYSDSSLNSGVVSGRRSDSKTEVQGKNEKAYVPAIVLLVDDIYTTGATIEGCTKVLLAAGVKKVYYTSVAIGSVT
jgi:predicted amidophosphoribosyltransferase